MGVRDHRKNAAMGFASARLSNTFRMMHDEIDRGPTSFGAGDAGSGLDHTNEMVYRAVRTHEPTSAAAPLPVDA